MAESDIDLLYGIKAIATCVNLTPRQTKHLAEAKRIPTFKLGKTVCARRSSLVKWLETLESDNG